MPDVTDMKQGYAYYVYTTSDNPDPMDAYAILRAKIREGYIVNVERLVDGEWEYDPDGSGDIMGITGATGVKRVHPKELRAIIKANSEALDPDEVRGH